jgi:hypothetical protein
MEKGSVATSSHQRQMLQEYYVCSKQVLANHCFFFTQHKAGADSSGLITEDVACNNLLLCLVVEEFCCSC